ncbi:MAG: ATP synthase F1 subunit epsilon [Planctomycetota bacterium]
MPETQLRCVVVTPEETVLDQEAEFIALPLFDGELGVALGHSPMIGRLGFGELRLRSAGGSKRYYVDGGFAQVADNVVSVLTNQAIPATDIDKPAAEEKLRSAAAVKAAGPEELAIKERTVSRARAQLRVATKA